MNEDINKLKDEINELNIELKKIQDENKKNERIKNIKVFIKRVEKYTSYILLIPLLIGGRLLNDNVNTIPIPVPTFLTRDGSNFITMPVSTLIFFVIYFGLCRSKTQDNIEEIYNILIEDIKKQYPSIDDREIREMIKDKENEYYHLLRVNNIPQR